MNWIVPLLLAIGLSEQVQSAKSNTSFQMTVSTPDYVDHYDQNWEQAVRLPKELSNWTCYRAATNVITRNGLQVAQAGFKCRDKLFAAEAMVECRLDQKDVEQQELSLLYYDAKKQERVVVLVASCRTE
jgi:hypothetical protein